MSMRGFGYVRFVLWIPFIWSKYTLRKNVSIGGTLYSASYSNSFQLFREGKIDYWITREKSFKEPRVIFIYSFKSLWLHLTCDKVYVDYGSKDVLWFLIGGASVLNLWHGMPIKRIENDIEVGPLSKKFSGERKHLLYRMMYYQDSFCRYNSVLINSHYHKQILQNTFNTENIVLGRAPRIKVWGSKRKTTTEERKVAFCLTFNDSGKEPPLLRAILDFQERYSCSTLELYIVLHPRDKVLFNSLNKEGVSNVKLGFDPSHFGPGDVLISEQSSLLFDADLAGVDTGLLDFAQHDLRDQYMNLSEFMDLRQVIRSSEDIRVYLDRIIRGYTNLGWTEKLGFV
jgi:hypothetical protein